MKVPKVVTVEVPDEEVRLIGFQPSVVTGGLEAWGCHPSVKESFRIAHQDFTGTWQAEGTINREPPPDCIMRQIYDILEYAHGQKTTILPVRRPD